MTRSVFLLSRKRREGYDGRGVSVLHSAKDNVERLRVDGFLERYIERSMEISVMVAADGQGATAAYEPVEMVFHEAGNVLDYLVAPARLEVSLLAEARRLAVSTIEKMQGKGIFGVEMFLTPRGELLINEISPPEPITVDTTPLKPVRRLNLSSSSTFSQANRLAAPIRYDLPSCSTCWVPRVSMATPWWKALIRRRMIRPYGCIYTVKTDVSQVAKWGM